MLLNKQNLSSTQQETFIAHVLGALLISFGPARMPRVWLVVGQATGMSGLCSVSHPPVGYLKQAFIAVSEMGGQAGPAASVL